MARRMTVLALAAVLAGCGTDGATKFRGPAPVTQHFQFKCTLCHDAAATPGADNLPTCATAKCHPSQITHHPGDQQQCLACHHAHTSSNLALVREEIMTPSGASVPVEFTVLAGLAPGGLAHGDGSGLCEVCHTTTDFYRADGNDDPHFTFTCFTCHPHALGFAPLPTPTPVS